MQRKLTAKQNKFIDGVLSGLTQTEAYRRAYETKNMKPKTIVNKAYSLASQGDIREIIEHRRKVVANMATWNRQQALQMLVDIANDAKAGAAQSGTYNSNIAGAAIRAIDQANKMCGYNEPEKIEIMQGQIFRVVIDGVDGIDDE